MIRLMIVDDHKLFREGLRKLLEAEETVEIVEEVNNGYDCLSSFRLVKPDIILLDLTMPEMDGITTLQALNKYKTRPKVIILTAHDEVAYLMQIIALEFDGYLLKNSRFEDLMQAIHYVHGGEKYIQPSLLPLINSMLIANDTDKNYLKLLSNREIEVLKLVAIGCLNKDIGDTLCISERTVKNHLSAIFRKIRCTDRTQAAVFCIRNGLISVYD